MSTQPLLAKLVEFGFGIRLKTLLYFTYHIFFKSWGQYEAVFVPSVKMHAYAYGCSWRGSN